MQTNQAPRGISLVLEGKFNVALARMVAMIQWFSACDFADAGTTIYRNFDEMYADLLRLQAQLGVQEDGTLGREGAIPKRVESAIAFCEEMYRQLHALQWKYVTSLATAEDMRGMVNSFTLIDSQSYRDAISTYRLEVAKPGMTQARAVELFDKLDELLISGVEAETAAQVASVIVPPPSRRKTTRRYVVPGEKKSDAGKKSGKKPKEGGRKSREMAGV